LVGKPVTICSAAESVIFIKVAIGNTLGHEYRYKIIKTSDRTTEIRLKFCDTKRAAVPNYILDDDEFADESDT